MQTPDCQPSNTVLTHPRKWVKVLFGAVLVVVLGTLPLTAWAGDFPGKGSRTKWEEASKYNSLGIKQAKERNYQEAQDLFQKAINAYGQDPSFYHNTALVYELQNQQNQAESYYENALKVDSHYGQSWINLGHLYNAQGKILEALKAYKNAVKCNLSEPTKKEVLSSIKVLEIKHSASKAGI
jgi:tetratricopeptide (TPR) repeat protein